MANNNARHMRKNPTEAERKLWSRLRRKQLHNFHFRRQHPVGPYILDFYCFEAQLAIELDGGQHYDADVIAYDQARTEFLNSQGITVLRFDNKDVFENMDGVLDKVCFYLMG